MPNPQHSETERLDHGPNWLKHAEDGLLLGECRFKAQYPKAQTKFWMSRHIIHALPKFARRCELALTKRLLSRALRKLNMQCIFSRIGWARGKRMLQRVLLVVCLLGLPGYIEAQSSWEFSYVKGQEVGDINSCQAGIYYKDGAFIARLFSEELDFPILRVRATGFQPVCFS